MSELCPVSLAEIENDQPYRSFNRDALEEHDRAMDNLRSERREFIESMLNNGYASVKNGRESKNYSLMDAIEMISDSAFWQTKALHVFRGETMYESLDEISQNYSDESIVANIYLNGGIPEWHAEIHKQVVLLADMALGEV